MRIGSIVVRVRPGTADAVASRFDAMSNVEIAHKTENGFALVVEAESPDVQEEQHMIIAGWPEVEEASLVFQSGEV